MNPPRKPDTWLVFAGAFLTAWGPSAAVHADTWWWTVIDVAAALAGAYGLKRFADQALAWKAKP